MTCSQRASDSFGKAAWNIPESGSNTGELDDRAGEVRTISLDNDPL
jgi:hypothetical protein